jgi:hypothetical protein
MGSGALIDIPSFIKIGAGIHKLIGGYTDSMEMHKPTLIFQKKDRQANEYTQLNLYPVQNCQR